MIPVVHTDLAPSATLADVLIASVFALVVVGLLAGLVGI